jgi:hypothetical protein
MGWNPLQAINAPAAGYVYFSHHPLSDKVLIRAFFNHPDKLVAQDPSKVEIALNDFQVSAADPGFEDPNQYLESLAFRYWMAFV